MLAYSHGVIFDDDPDKASPELQESNQERDGVIFDDDPDTASPVLQESNQKYDDDPDTALITG